MHQDDNFRLENKIKEFDSYIEKYISNNIPKVHRTRKIHLEDECYNLIKLLYEAIIKNMIKSWRIRHESDEKKN